MAQTQDFDEQVAKILASLPSRYGSFVTTLHNVGATIKNFEREGSRLDVIDELSNVLIKSKNELKENTFCVL